MQPSDKGCQPLPQVACIIKVEGEKDRQFLGLHGLQVVPLSVSVLALLNFKATFPPYLPGLPDLDSVAFQKFLPIAYESWFHVTYKVLLF